MSEVRRFAHDRREELPGWPGRAYRGSARRRLPSTAAVLKEQLSSFGGEWLVVSLIMSVPAIVGILLFIEPAAWMALPVWVGLWFGISSTRNRIQGIGIGWELPVRRSILNGVRNCAGIAWMFVALLLLTALIFLLAGEPLDHGMIPAMLMVSSWAIIPFSVMTITGQLVNQGRRYLVFPSLALVMPLMFVPSRGLLAILPDSLDPVVSGRYGLNTFSGRMLMRDGISAPPWDAGTWLITASLWLAIALSLLFLVGATHQE